MHHEIYENAQLNVVINGIRATDEEIEKLKEVITRGIGHQNIPPVITSNEGDKRGAIYSANFALRGPRDFHDETLAKWLHSVGLVGWSFESHAGPKQ